MSKVRLIQSVISKLPRPQGRKRMLYTDQELPGFALRLGATGGTYYANKRDPITGLMSQIRLGRMELLTPAQARETAKEVLLNVTAHKKARVEGLTGADLFDRFYNEYTKHLPVGEQDKYILGRHFLDAFGKTALIRITRDDLIKLVNSWPRRTKGHRMPPPKAPQRNVQLGRRPGNDRCHPCLSPTQV